MSKAASGNASALSQNKKNTRKPLGRGLSNLLKSDAAAGEAAGIREIEIERIRANPGNPRKKFEKTSIEELASTISAHGVLQPILVIEKKDHFMVVSGERRLRACRQLAFKTVPCIVKEYDDQTLLEVALIENIQREQLDAIEEAGVYKSLMETHTLTQEELARRVGKSRTAIANRVRLLQLPDSVQAAVADGRLSEGQVRPLLGIKSEAVQLKLVKEIESLSLTARQVEDLVNRQKGEKAKKVSRSTTPELRGLEKEIEERLQIRARINHNTSKNNGKLTLEYFSLEDLDKILKVLGIRR